MDISSAVKLQMLKFTRNKILHMNMNIDFINNVTRKSVIDRAVQSAVQFSTEKELANMQEQIATYDITNKGLSVICFSTYEIDTVLSSAIKNVEPVDTIQEEWKIDYKIIFANTPSKTEFDI